MSERENPFTPGTGLVPPVRAGHETIARALDTQLRRVLGMDPSNLVVMYGPRGNGKKTLLAELARKAHARNATVRIRTPNMLKDDAECVARDLANDGDTTLGLPASIQASAGFAEGGLTTKPTHSRRLKAILRDLARANPTVLLIDDAHTLPAELGCELLNAIQDCISDDLPLLAVLAGTPGLEDALSKTNAGFWERGLSLRVGRLEAADDVRIALAKPAEESGLPFDEDALDLLVGESQGYPFFIQMLGEAAWDAADQAGHDRIVLEDAREGLRNSESRRDQFCQGCRKEAEDSGTLAEAEAVSRDILRKGPDAELTENELKESLARVLGADRRAIVSARTKLSSLGLIWQTPGNTWEQGIPSLCRYINAHSRQQ